MKNTLRQLARLWNAAMDLLSNVMSRLILSIIYFLVVPPFAYLTRLFKDPLSAPLASQQPSATHAPTDSGRQSLTQKQENASASFWRHRSDDDGTTVSALAATASQPGVAVAVDSLRSLS